MGDLTAMSREKMQEALALVVEAEATCLAEWKEFAASLPRRLNAAQKERSAYLRGRLAGLHQAKRYFEMKAPINIVAS